MSNIPKIYYFYFFKAISTFINLAIVIFTAKILFLEDFAQYTFLISSAGVLAAASTIGLPALAVRKISHLNAHNDLIGINDWVSKSLFIQLTVTLVCIFLYGLILLFKGIGLSNIFLFSVFCLCSTIIVFFSEVLRGINKTLNAIIYLEFLRNSLIILPTLIFYFTFHHLTLHQLFIITTSSSLIIVFFCFAKIIPVDYYRKLPTHLKNIKKTLFHQNTKILIAEGLPFLGLAILGYIQLNDSFLLGFFIANKDLALTNLAFKICSILLVIFNSTILWFSTDIARFIATNEIDKLIIISKKIIYIQVSVSIIFSIILYLLFPYLIKYVGSKYENTSNLMLYYLIGLILSSFISTPATILAYGHKEKVVIKLLIINFSFYIITCYLIYPYFGFICVPITYSLFNFMYNIALSISVKKVFNFTPILFFR